MGSSACTDASTDMAGARTKRGSWLTAHALRSGLAEQWATQRGSTIMTVELRWMPNNNTFQVMTLRGRQIDKRTQHPSLQDARAAFTREKEYQTRRPLP